MRTRTTAENDGVRHTARRAPAIRSDGVRIPALRQFRTVRPSQPTSRNQQFLRPHDGNDWCCVEEETSRGPDM